MLPYFKYPDGMIVEVNGACPDGYTRDIRFDGRLVVGSDTFGNTGDIPHSHNFNSYSLFTNNKNVEISQGANVSSSNRYVTAYTHNHPYTRPSTISSMESTTPPYFTVVFCRKL